MMITYNFIKNNSKVDKEEENIISFGIEMAKVVSLVIVLAIIISVIMNEFFQAVIFMINLIPLRQFAGGYHTRHRWTCAIISLIIYVGSLLFFKFVQMDYIVQIMVVCLNIIIIFNMAPVDNSNNELDEDERLFYCEKTRMVLIFELLMFMSMMLFGFSIFSQVIVVAMSVVSILLLLGYASNKLGG